MRNGWYGPAHVELKSCRDLPIRLGMCNFNDFLREQIEMLKAASAESEARLLTSLLHCGFDEDEARDWIAVTTLEAESQ